MAIGMPQLLLILILALVIFGPKKLPDLGASLGKTIREFRDSTKDITDSIAKPIKEITDELAKPIQEINKEVVAPLKESMEGLDLNLSVDIANPLQSVTDSMTSIGKDISSSFTSDGKK